MKLNNKNMINVNREEQQPTDKCVAAMPNNTRVSEATKIAFKNIIAPVDKEIKRLKGRINKDTGGLAVPILIAVLHVIVVTAIIFGFVYGSTAIIITGAVLLSIAAILTTLTTLLVAYGVPHSSYTGSIFLLLGYSIIATLLPVFEIRVLIPDSYTSEVSDIKELRTLKKELKAIIKKDKEYDKNIFIKIINNRNATADILKKIVEIDDIDKEVLSAIREATANIDILKHIYANKNFDLAEYFSDDKNNRYNYITIPALSAAIELTKDDTVKKQLVDILTNILTKKGDLDGAEYVLKAFNIALKKSSGDAREKLIEAFKAIKDRFAKDEKLLLRYNEIEKIIMQQKLQQSKKLSETIIAHKKTLKEIQQDSKRIEQ